MDSLLTVKDTTDIQTTTLPDAAVEEIREVVKKYGGEVKSVGNTRTTLEDLFLRIVEESRLHPGRRAHGAGNAVSVPSEEGTAASADPSNGG